MHVTWILVCCHDKANETDNRQGMKNETIIWLEVGKATVRTGFGCLVSTSCALFGQLGQVKATRFTWVTWVLILQSISQQYSCGLVKATRFLWVTWQSISQHATQESQPFPLYMARSRRGRFTWVTWQRISQHAYKPYISMEAIIGSSSRQPKTWYLYSQAKRLPSTLVSI